MKEKELKIRQEGDSVFGPGIYDMKAGGYIAYYALRHLIRQGKKTKLPVTFLFIPEEEVGSPTSRARIEEAARGHKYALVMEPGRDGDKVVTSRKGVGRFTLTVKGRAAHAGVRHEDGRSAILEIARQIVRIEEKTDYAPRHHLQRRPDPRRLGRQRDAGRMLRSTSTCACPACSSPRR